jgi:LysR family transcriptional regulator (chromosome initiation inhibitor)
MDLQLEQLRTLVSVLDAGSFDAAARAMSVTPSAVSQRIKALEQQVGRVLVQRSKPVRLTDAGSIVLRLARQLELLEAEASAALDNDGVTNLAIVANADSLDTWLLPALATVEGVTFDIRREDQEHSVELLRQGTVMGAVTSDPEPVQGCTVTRLGVMTYRPMAVAGFAQRWPSLSTAPVVVFDRKDSLQDAYLMSQGIDPAAPPRHYVPGSAAFVDAVALGMGWGMLPDLQSAGREGLVVLDESGAVDVPLYWQQWALDSRALATTAAALRAAFAMNNE